MNLQSQSALDKHCQTQDYIDRVAGVQKQLDFNAFRNGIYAETVEYKGVFAV
ncbi:hypothetical protein Vi05172_g2391 [Venturia inaequalis]|nr:hypothetical protein Vi05172_g2391 [Venturia inaequalis]